MKIELEHKIYLACPKLYRRKYHVSKNNDKGLMRLGVYCADGWFELLLKVSVEIENIIRELEKEGCTEALLPYAGMIQEKYGSLRIDVCNETNEIEKLVDEAEDSSETVCEYCGNTGELRTNRRWIKCLCSLCNEEK